jgi:anti-sigma regulatory factor (Ser/Thr protein kinase)
MTAGFEHEALLYEGLDGFVSGTVPFLRGAVAAGQPALVVVARPKLDALRDALGADAAGVQFADMADVGANPALIIPAWQEFVTAHGGTGSGLAGIGEPIWPERRRPELLESQLHERLLNVAFADAAGFRLVCPYDVSALDPEVIEEAARSHPVLLADGERRLSDGFVLDEQTSAPRPWTPRPDGAVLRDFDRFSLATLRDSVRRLAASAGIPFDRASALVLAVNEIATNSIRHGGGAGRLAVWLENGVLVCEVSDPGRLGDPLADRRRPGPGVESPRGLWTANQLCDLVQVRSGPDGTAVRLHLTATGPASS